MFFRRIKAYLKTKQEAILLAFEIAHFFIDVVIVIHLVFPHSGNIA